MPSRSARRTGRSHHRKRPPQLHHRHARLRARAGAQPHHSRLRILRALRRLPLSACGLRRAARNEARHPHRNAGARPRLSPGRDSHPLRRVPGPTATASACTSAGLHMPRSATAKPPRIAICRSPTAPSQRPFCSRPSPRSMRSCSSNPRSQHDLSEVEFFTNADESALLVSLFTQRKSPDGLPRSVADALLPALPALNGVHTFLLDPKTRRIQPSSTWGQPSLDYTVGPHRYQVSAGAFFQVNRYLVPELLEEVVAGRQGGARLGPLRRRRTLRPGARAAIRTRHRGRILTRRLRPTSPATSTATGTSASHRTPSTSSNLPHRNNQTWS